MIYKAVLGEVQVEMDEDLKKQAMSKVKAKIEAINAALEKVARIDEEYAELLESEVVKENCGGWVTIGNGTSMEISNCTFNGEAR